MGINYDVTYHNAIIKPERYGDLIGWTAGEVAAEPERAAEVALEHVMELLGGWCEPEQTAEGIDISSYGYYDSASHSYGDQLIELLSFCEPGAYLHDIDAEGGSGRQYRLYKMPDGSLKDVHPIITWPEVIQEGMTL